MTITVDQMVHREINCCLSSLVATLASDYPEAAVGKGLQDLCEQAFELAAPVADYEEAAFQHGAKIVSSDFAPKWVVLDQPNTLLWDAFFDSEAEAARAYCEHYDLDPYEREIYEHWSVSNWLAEKLIEEGEKVDTDFSGLNVWARTTTGQLIAMDGVMKRIHAKMMEA